MTPLAQDALAALSAMPPSALRDRFVAQLESHPDAVRRDGPPHHLTASVLVLSHDHTRVLLTLHRKARQWFQLGGHLEPGDTTLAGAALREATEESGIAGLVVLPTPVHLDEHAVPFCRPGAHHLDVRYVAIAPEGAEHVAGEESLDLAWWPVDALPTEEESIHALVAAALTASAGVGDAL